VDAENLSTSPDVGILVDQPAEPIASHDLCVGRASGLRDSPIGGAWPSERWADVGCSVRRSLTAPSPDDIGSRSAEEVDMVEVGDRVLVESEKVGMVTRSGVVMAVDGRLITVRWDSGSQSVFIPSAGSLRVTGHEPPAGEVNSS
jgi:hypothetical protein